MKIWCFGLVAGLGFSSLLAAGEAKLLSLRLAPQDPALWGANASQRFLVLGKYGDGLERDLTAECRFSLSDARIAKVDASGSLVALADGQVTLTAALGGQSAKTSVRISGLGEKRPFSFARDIGGILTKRGCNDSGCHGGVKGQSGFKLSLNGLYARDDYKWIVEGGIYQVLTAESGGPKIPRVDLKQPEQSLLLRKAAMAVPHGGGQIFRPDSADYAAVLEWVRSGAPYGEEGKKESVQVDRIEVFPKEIVLDPEGKHQLLVTAYLSNGRREDFTDRVRYKSNNPEVANVTPEGRVEAARTGETSILIRAAGYAVSTGVGVIARSVPNYPNVARNNFIDDHVFAKLRKFNIIPSALSGDAEFLRRLCLDVAGTLPPPDRVREFLASRDPRKREKLIEALLSSPEYVDYWTFRFADLFRVTRYANQINTKDSHMYWEWIRAAIESHKPYDQIARERIAAQGFDGPASHFFPYSDVRNPEHKMPEEVRVFMGRRLDCAQCHNHPFETWSQDQFWGMTAFFGRMNGIKFGPHDDNLYGSILYDDPKGQEVDYGVVDKTGKVVHPRTNLEVQPTFLDGAILAEEERRDLRWKLAEWMTAHPYFAEAAVNRMWGYFFGRGIVDPVDDFRSTNPPSHPELLKALAQEFREHGHDLKHLIRAIVSSRTYQLSSEPNESNAEDRLNYSHYVPRQLDAEVLLDATAQATGVPEELWHTTNQGQPGMLPLGARAINLVEPDVFRHQFLEVYGKPTRLAVPERKNEGNLGQALHMLVGQTYNDRLSKEGGRLDRSLKSGASDREIIEELYVAGLSRFPTESERSELEKFVQQRASRTEAFRSILWGLITSREFATNH